MLIYSVVLKLAVYEILNEVGDLTSCSSHDEAIRVQIYCLHVVTNMCNTALVRDPVYNPSVQFHSRHYLRVVQQSLPW